MVFITVLFSGGRCSLPLKNSDKTTLRIMSYNVENIFDDVDNGTEYAEFDPGKGVWNESLYHLRLVNLADVIKASCRGGPDIIALQEIENEKVVSDLVSLYLKGMGYTAVAVTHKKNSAVQVGIISKIPFTSVTVHDVCAESGQRIRPVLEVSVKTGSGMLFILNNHWKSRIGGSRETEEQRILDASIDRKRMKELAVQRPDADFLVLGDFNERCDEYERTGKLYQTALMPADSVENPGGLTGTLFVTGRLKSLTPDNASFLVYAPWMQYNGSTGSYFYKGHWERIDHLFISYGLTQEKGFLFESFTVPDIPFALTPDGIPFGWSTRQGAGYSDHLPVLVTLKYEP